MTCEDLCVRTSEWRVMYFGKAARRLLDAKAEVNYQDCRRCGVRLEA